MAKSKQGGTAARRAQRQNAVNRSSDSQVAAASEQLGEASSQLTALADQLAIGTTQTAAQATRVAASTEKIKTHVASVASTAEEMGSTVREISANASDSAKTARQARSLASSANSTVQALNVSSAAIGKVTKVISAIAQQTNLLALNATIEAARAGEAGKGFAVVANEVKELAKETARATEEIIRQIETIQNNTGKSVTAIGEIVTVIEQIDGFASSIVRSLEKQAAHVNAIMRNTSEVLSDVTGVVDNIGGAVQATREAEKRATLTQSAANRIDGLVSELNELVKR